MGKVGRFISIMGGKAKDVGTGAGGWGRSLKGAQECSPQRPLLSPQSKRQDHWLTVRSEEVWRRGDSVKESFYKAGE